MKVALNFAIDYGSNFSLSIVNDDKNDWITRNAAKAKKFKLNLTFHLTNLALQYKS